MTRQAGLALLLCALTLAGLTIGLSILQAGGDPLSHWSFRIPIALSVPVYLVSVWLLLDRGQAPSLGLIVAVAVLLRVALVVAPPMLSSDVYRYVWDGRVQAAGINPYLHVPADPALAALRDAAIYPNINRADYAPTIYPPAAQALFAAVAALSPTVIAMKAAMAAFDGLTIACLLRLLARAGRPAGQVLIYAWNPLALWEFAGNGHVDAAAAGLLVLAILLRTGGGGRFGLAGITIGGAMLMKFLPAIAAPALWRRGAPGFRLAAGAFGCVTLLYLFYLLFDGAGSKVLGFLGGYGGEEGLDTGRGIWTLAGLGLWADLPRWVPKAYLLAVVAGLCTLGAWIAFRPQPPAGTNADILRVCSDAGLLIGCLMIALSPHYAWYYVWLAAPAAIVPYRALIWLSVASVLLYENPFADHFLWQSLLFVPALVLGWRDLRTARADPRLPELQGSF